jgi:hypothetical protein
VIDVTFQLKASKANKSRCIDDGFHSAGALGVARWRVPVTSRV